MPLSLGDLAQPGSTSAGIASIWPRQIRLPGSTGMPKWSIVPPARTIAAGPTSRRSTTAEAPAISRICAPWRRSRFSASAIGAVSCRVRSGGSRVPCSASIRSRVASTAPSITLSFWPGSSLSTRPTFSGRKGCSDSGGGPCFAMVSATWSTAPGTAKGMTLMVASISLAETGMCEASVATVSDSSSAFSRSIVVASTTSRPGVSANRFTRPVEARERPSSGPIRALASRSAASSSGTSPGSSRAAMTLPWPPCCRAAIAGGSSTVPFFRTRPCNRTVCARMAPRASSSGVGPKIMRRRPRARRGCRVRRPAGRRPPRPGSRARSPAR